MARGETAAARVAAARGLGWRRVRQQALLLVLALALPAAAALTIPGTLATWCDRQILLKATPWPQYTFLSVIGAEAGKVHAPRGEDYHLFVQARGLIPSTGTIRWSTPEGRTERGRLTRVGAHRLRFVFHTLSRPLACTISAGDDVIGPVTLIPVDRPTLEELTLTVTEPAYTGRPPRPVDLLALEGDLGVLDRSRLTLAGRADKLLAGALVKVGRRELPCRLDPAQGHRFTFRLQPDRSLTLQIFPRDRHGLTPRPAPKVRLEVLADQPPRVELKALGIGAMVAPRARIPLLCRCRDDLALTALTLRSGLLPAGESELPDLTGTSAAGLDAFTPGKERFAGDLLWTAKNFKLAPGPTLLLAAIARDNFAPGEPHTGSSSILRFKVVSEEVLIKDLQRRQRELRAELEAATDSLAALREDLARNRKAEKRLPRVLHGFVVQLTDAAQRMAAILAEWENNQLPGAAKVRTLTQEVVGPLEDQAVPALTRARERAAALLMGREAAAGEILPLVDRALAALRRVLETLSRLEDFQRVVELTRALLRTQGEAKKALETRLQKTLQDLFGEGEKEK